MRISMVLLSLLAAAPTLLAQSAAPAIQDNSFLVEEAYNRKSVAHAACSAQLQAEDGARFLARCRLLR